MEVLAQLGEGAFSHVYLVWSRTPIGSGPPGTYALKQMVQPRENRQNIEREIRAHEVVHGHAHLLELVGSEVRTSPSNPDAVEALLLFPYCEGGTLAKAQAAAPGGFAESQALQIMAQLCDAVAHCHSHGVTHRDIKLTNVYLHDGRWILADLGSATLSAERAVLHEREALALARHEVETLTTPEYRAPEQVGLQLGSALGPEVDVWALGVTLFQLACSANPYATPLATLSERALCAAEARAGVEVKGLLDSMLAREPEQRCSASEALARCRAAVARDGATAGAAAGLSAPNVEPDDHPPASPARTKARSYEKLATATPGSEGGPSTEADVAHV